MAGPLLDERYRVLDRLGEGGMGEVYLVENLQLERREALKVLLPALAAAPQLVQRFRREARATLRLQHPHIVGGYDFGRLPDGRLYLSMEYVEGEPLDRLLRREGPFPVPRALGVLAQLADAVAHAHECGVVHRDLKPSNLMMVEERGQPDFLKVLDFGIAKIVAPDYQESRGLTSQGEVFGTVQYMAPEQVAGAPVDPRCDLYAIGCIAFELLVGETPFVGRRMEILDAHLRRAPEPPSRRRPDAALPEELEAIVLRCLEKDPARRFSNARGLLSALEGVPGFAERGRRRPTLHSLVTQPMVLLSEMELHRTLFERRDDGEPTAPLPAAGRVAANALILKLAEALVDRGHTDVQLVVGIARLGELEGELERLEAEEDVVEARAAQLETAARGRESALRGSIGELRFERDEGGDAAEITRHIVELEAGLVEIVRQLDRDRAALSDRAIELVARKATIEEKLTGLSLRLEQLVAEKLPLLDGAAELLPIVARFRELSRGRR